MNKIGADDYKEGAPLSLFSTLKIENDENAQISTSHQTKTQSDLTSNQKSNHISLENIDNKEKAHQANAFNSSQKLDSDHDKSIGISSKTFNELSLKELYEILKAQWISSWLNNNAPIQRLMESTIQRFTIRC